MEVNIEEVPQNKARKRKRDPKQWKRAVEKLERYKPQILPAAPRCGHDSKTYKCATLTLTDLMSFFEAFYDLKTKPEQDAFLLKYCQVNDIKRRRARGARLRQPAQYSAKLFVKKCNKNRLIPVCQNTFINILHITVHRIRRVAQTFKMTGSTVKENRGGDHTSQNNVMKLVAVKRFIKSFQCLESHYCRSSVERKYLPATLNIRKMWKMFSNQTALRVKECYFRRVFNTYFNIGFGSPRTDTCSKCTEFTEKIKLEPDVSKKNTLIIEKRVHNLKAKAFYRLLKERKEGMLTFSFDCQKNQPLPKVPDQAAYYSRQLYIYNFAIVQSVPSSELNKETVSLYSWTEDQYRKGANEIASAVFHKLNTIEIESDINTIRLVADGCGAQNKNSIMIGMCSIWLANNAPRHVKCIEFVFPIPGHSFLPADSVFGVIEKELKNREDFLTPEQYQEVFDNRGTLVKFSTNFDWKTVLHDAIKPPGNWHFQFATCKRYYLLRTNNNKILVKGEEHYNSDRGKFKTILKKNKSFLNIEPTAIEKDKVIIKDAKLKDVDNLLKKHFGQNWKSLPNLTYYKRLVENPLRRSEDAEDPIEMCEAAVPDTDLCI